MKLTKLASFEAKGWTFEFDAPVGERVLKRFHSVTTFGPDVSLWWCHSTNRWVRYGEHQSRNIGSHSRRVRSFKAFMRHLEAHPILEEAAEVVLVSRFVGHSIRAFPPGRAALEGSQSK